MEADYCKSCGYGLMAEEKNEPFGFSEIKNAIKNTFSLVAVLSFVTFLVLNTAIMLWSIDLIGPETLTSSTILYVVFFIVIPVTTISAEAFLVYFALLVAGVFLSYIALSYKGGKDFFIHVHDIFENITEKSKKSDTPIPRLAHVFTALIFVSYLYYILIGAFGVSPQTPGFTELDLWQLMFGLTEAAVWEEVTVRVVFIGIPMLAYAYTKGKKLSLKYLLGGFGLKDRFAIWPILLSSVIFGIAHLGSWDLYKLVPTFIAGLAFGYLFAKDGLFSCIILHFVWDFMSIPGKVFNTSHIENVMIILVLTWMLIGLYFTYHYTKRTVSWLFKPKKKARKKRKKEYEGVLTAGVTAAYVCPQCNNTTAVYTKNGKLRCKRCGQISEPTSSNVQRSKSKVQVNRQWPPPE